MIREWITIKITVTEAIMEEVTMEEVISEVAMDPFKTVIWFCLLEIGPVDIP